jgi:hypothetical protein
MLICSNTSSTHDSAVLNGSDFYQKPESDYFEDPKGYILGDSAYRLTNRVLKPFTDPQLKKDDPAGSRRFFNNSLASARVKVEHAFGIMKCRFPALAKMHFIVGLGPKASAKQDGDKMHNKRVSFPLIYI